VDRGALPADCGVSLAKAALEGHEDVAAAFDVVADLLEECVVGDVEGGDDEELYCEKSADSGNTKSVPTLAL